MDVSLSESESMLRETALRLADHLACQSVGEFEDYDSAAAWKALQAVGLIDLRLPNAVGGGGATTFDAAIVTEALARRVVPVPYLGSALAIELLLAAGAAPPLLDRVGSGELRCTIGVSVDLAGTALVDGSDPLAFDGADAAAILLLGPDGDVRALAAGPARPGTDLTRTVREPASSDDFDLGSSGGVLDPESRGRFLARALTLISADLLGLMTSALDLAVAYAANRVQFGVPIGSFQAVQQLAADQLVSLEGARSLVEYAAWAADRSDLDEALLAAHSAKAYCSRAGRTLCEAVVQIHGGMGITWDCMAHVYLKRALIDAVLLGDYHRQISAVIGLRERRAA